MQLDKSSEQGTHMSNRMYWTVSDVTGAVR